MDKLIRHYHPAAPNQMSLNVIYKSNIYKSNIDISYTEEKVKKCDM